MRAMKRRRQREISLTELQDRVRKEAVSKLPPRDPVLDMLAEQQNRWWKILNYWGPRLAKLIRGRIRDEK